ncbi:Protein CBR-PQN-42 [Caenorhabditis briggsae]|uniref:Protein CBR-PQN-42 n=1 Tax=Caenorhabditis briggsae TaxID=6238 RepID=B0K0B1_CAEBR|nr:Protein CBR-PQN-42 [Caenorhabditis briggsae]CAP38239.1 Protein CBR-PQN-42 [Caenorhabditis briggsae]
MPTSTTVLIPYLLLTYTVTLAFCLHLLQQCSSSPSITFRGANDVTRAGGPALIVFAPLQCANCYNYLRRLNDLAGTRSYRISVVAPDFESNHIIQRTSTAFPNLQIDRAGEGWPRLGAKNFDAIVLDSCSRVTETFEWPQSDVTTSTTIQTALQATSFKCGGGSAGIQKCQNSNNSKKRVNAWIKEQEQQEQMRRAQNSPRHQNSQNSQNPQNSQNRHFQNHQNGQNQNFQTSQNRHQNPPHHLNSQQNTYSNHNSYNNGYQSLYTPPPPPPPPQVVPTEKLTTTTPDASGPDYDYYPEGDTTLLATTQSTQTQIPRPPSGNNGYSENNGPWPTYPSYYQHNQNQQNQWNPYQPNPYHKIGPNNPALLMDANLPCSAFTDDICHQQREQMGSLVSKCCNKGIYLTDVCIPGKCSNSTIQLCCFQKFLQAKFSCCSDPAQDEGAPKMTNRFNKCCHNNFITEDPCCPEVAARKYWSTAFEVCMPTVVVDFSPVRFEVHFTEGVRVIDLSVDRQWEFNCTHGTKQPQFAYLPSDHIVSADFIRGLKKF